MSFLDQFRPPAPAVNGRTPTVDFWTPFRGGGQGYAQAALEREVDDLAAAPQGKRNHQLNAAAFSLGQLVAGGELSRERVIDALTGAAQRAGLSALETLRTIDSGLRSGAGHPRTAPARDGVLYLPSGEKVTEVTQEVTAEEIAGRRHVQVLVEVERLRIRHEAAQAWDEERSAADREAATHTNRVTPGDIWALDSPPGETPIWGEGDDVLWARGEALMIAGPQGTGKTTLAGQLLRGVLGLTPEVLGYPVAPTEGRVLYLAMDRPAQARRNLARLFTPADRHVLADKLRVWQGPPPADLAASPEVLLDMCQTHGATAVIVDSIKDAAVGLSKDEVGAGYNRARQEAIAAGVQVLELHHVVKNGADGSQPRHLRDIYGSAWLTNGVGSVLMLWGEAGDPLIEVTHLKQPIDTVGPFKILHDAETGVSSIYADSERDVVALAKRCESGISATDAACAMFAAEAPNRGQVERARRKLRALEKSGHLRAVADGTGRGHTSVWVAVEDNSWADETDRRYR